MKVLRTTAFATAALAFGLAVAACGSSGGTSAAPSGGTTASGSSGSSGSVMVKTADSSLGTILVDSSGKTLYIFAADTAGKSNCDAACASEWPPVTTKGKPQAGAGVQGGMLGTTMRSDGTEEVTYAGHPLYWFEGDSKPGDTNGQGLTDFGGSWSAVSPAGKAVQGSGGGYSRGSY